MQVSPVPQAWEQAPQFCSSLTRLAQPAPQSISPEPQVLTQAPPEQTWPEGQALLQEPQLELLPARLTQPLSQLVVPFWHTHWPALQELPAPHELPQAPQLFASLEVLTHSPLHSVWKLKQRARQTPNVHTWPVLQTLVQLPQ